jgi:hypothetical protein
LDERSKRERVEEGDGDIGEGGWKGERTKVRKQSSFSSRGNVKYKSVIYIKHKN